jgi:hypothetical protein
MRTVVNFSLSGIVALLALLCGSAAMAAACTGVNVGTSATGDVTLHGSASSQCEIVDGNSGMMGGDSALIPSDGFFGGGSWLQIGGDGSILHSGGPVNGITFTSFGFTGTALKNGGWGLGWTGGPSGVDLLFSMHAGGFSGFFVFEGVDLSKDASWVGTWLIKWFNSSGHAIGNESNVQVWARPDLNVNLTSVPEPASLALVGLGLLCLVATSFRQQRT